MLRVRGARRICGGIIQVGLRHAETTEVWGGGGVVDVVEHGGGFVLSMSGRSRSFEG